jgi:hypothetical protein
MNDAPHKHGPSALLCGPRHAVHIVVHGRVLDRERRQLGDQLDGILR